ncbi:hypothetical protein GGQ84_000469 [Desulfitispora alkaliphila]|uniref:hypothetical protein n=1 Tax=Desulfitispora alkaliphila TaxID=622674 RepID=UPI003D1948BA
MRVMDYRVERNNYDHQIHLGLELSDGELQGKPKLSAPSLTIKLENGELVDMELLDKGEPVKVKLPEEIEQQAIEFIQNNLTKQDFM